MNETTVDENRLYLEDIPENFCHPAADLMLEYWVCIAVTAWEGFLTSGPGMVVIEVTDGEVEIWYYPGSACSCHPISEQTYNPQEQVVIMLVREDEAIEPFTIGGWPTPLEIYGKTQAEVMGATVH